MNRGKEKERYRRVGAREDGRKDKRRGRKEVGKGLVQVRHLTKSISAIYAEPDFQMWTGRM